MDFMPNFIEMKVNGSFSKYSSLDDKNRLVTLSYNNHKIWNGKSKHDTCSRNCEMVI